MPSGEAGPSQSLSVPLFRGQERVMSSLSWQRHPDHTYSISLDGPDGLVTGTGDDLFEALKVIRLELNPRGWMLSVQGAREDAYASGMQRNMVGARRVYIIRIGCQVEKGDPCRYLRRGAAGPYRDGRPAAALLPGMAIDHDVVVGDVGGCGGPALRPINP